MGLPALDALSGDLPASWRGRLSHGAARAALRALARGACAVVPEKQRCGHFALELANVPSECHADLRACGWQPGDVRRWQWSPCATRCRLR